MKAKPISALIALSLLTFSLVAFAQQPATVGELLDKGGKKLTKDELAKLVTGATMSGISPINPSWKSQTTFKGDGSYSGIVVRAGAGVGTSGIFGKWSLNDQGLMCTDGANSSNQRIQNCNFFFRLGTAYYMGPTDDRTAQLLEREIKR